MHLLRKYHSYLGVISASFIFISWVLTNSALKQAESLESSYYKSIEGQRTYRRHSNIMRMLSNTEKQLNRIELRGTNEIEPEPYDEAVEALVDVGNKLQWIQTWSSDASALQSHAESAIRHAELLSEKHAARIRMTEICDKAFGLVTLFYTTRGNFRTSFENITKGKKGFSLTIPPDNWRDIADLINKHERDIRNVTADYLSVSNEIYRSLAALNMELSKKIKRAKIWAEILKYITYFLFVVGTFLSLYSKFVEAKIKRIESKISNN